MENIEISEVDNERQLKLTKDELRQLQPNNPVFSKITTPESIADNIGNTAGQNM